jgi:hypothetical protein
MRVIVEALVAGSYKRDQYKRPMDWVMSPTHFDVVGQYPGELSSSDGEVFCHR